MKKIPVQFYIFAIALLSYYWPWEIFSSSAFTVFTVQAVFVALCDRIVKEDWVISIISIECLVALFNVTFFLNPSISVDLHAQITLTAFIMELLIIAGSFTLGGASDDSRGDVVGYDDIRGAGIVVHRKNFTGTNI